MRTPERYLALVAAGESTEAAGERLDSTGRRLEALQLDLRTNRGVPASALDTEGLDGLVEPQGDRVVLTPGRAPLGQRGRPPPALNRQDAKN